MKGEKVIYILPLAGLLVLLVVGAAVWAQSSSGYDLSWHTISSGGGKISSNSYQINGTIGQMNAGYLSSSSYGLQGGFQQDFSSLKPEAIDDLIITKNADSAQLGWSAITQDTGGNQISNVTYNVYRAIGDPYFTPGTAYASGLTTPSYADPDTTVLTDPNHNASYLVTAVSNGRESDYSNRVGTFNFSLTPGTQ